MAKTSDGDIQVIEAPAMPGAVPEAQPPEVISQDFGFGGQWVPSLDPLEIGAENYRTLENIRYSGPTTAVSLTGVNGYSAISHNTTVWVEVDPTSRLTIDASGITFTGMTYNEDVYAICDFGAAYFSGNFTHQLSFRIDSGAAGASNFIWALSNQNMSFGDVYDLGTGYGAGYEQAGLTVYMNDTTHFTLQLVGWGTDPTGITGLEIGVAYYLDIIRDESVGTYGTITCNAYTDPARTSLAGTCTYTCWVEKSDYRYIYGISTYNYAAHTEALSGWTSGADFVGAHLGSITALAQFRTENESRVFAVDSNKNVYSNATAIPSAGEFSTSPVFSEDSAALTPFMATGPRGTLFFCDGKENRSYFGLLSEVSGFFTGKSIATSRNDIALNDNGASDDTIVTTAGQFFTDGFRAGMEMTVSGATTSGNNVTTKIKTISADGKTITVATGTLAGTDAAGASTVTITAATRYLTNLIDASDKVGTSVTTTGVFIGTELDANVKLMLHCNGASGSTTFTDSSAAAHSVTASGNARISSNSKFGSGAAYFDGTGDYLSSADSADWDFGTGAFTIEFWFRFLSTANNTRAFMQQYNADDERWFCEMAGLDRIQFYTFSATSSMDLSVYGPNPEDNNGLCEPNRWYHCAVIRGWAGDANKFVVCLDGKPGTVVTNSGTMPNIAAALRIGRRRVYGGGSYYYMNGYMDEIRITKGVAKWTSEFTPMTRAYSDTSNDSFIALTPMPLSGLNISLSGINATAATLTGYTFTGKDFESLAITDGTSSGGVSLAKNGSITFDDTASGAKPFHFQGAYLYAYLFHLSAGWASIYHVTAQTGFNPVNDIWDSVLRQPVAFQKWIDASKTYADYTVGVNIKEATTYITGVSADLSSLTTSDWVEIICEDRAAAFQLNMISGASNANAAAMNIEYWNGTAFVSVNGLNDGTIGDYDSIPLSKSGLVAWDVPDEGEEVAVSKFGQTGFLYRMSFSASLSSSVKIDTCYIVPAQKTIRPFRFPVMFGSRIFLCGGATENDAARCDYSAPNAPNVFNGALSSNDGLQSIYFGGNTPVTGAAQLFNRFGSNIVSALVMWKDTETYMLVGDSPENFAIFPISSSLGCPAPRTIVAAEAGFVMGEGLERNIALWLSYRGPVIFDGTVIKPLAGVEPYFDPADARCINPTYIASACGWYDTTYKEYNLCIPSGSSAPENNCWLVYDLQRQRWYVKKPATYYPAAAATMVDTHGTRYIYAGLTTGKVMRLENGTTWAGDPLVATIETGDFLPAKTSWFKTLLRRLKFWGPRVTEAADVMVTHFSDTTDNPVYATRTDISFGTDGTGTFIKTAGTTWAALGFSAGLGVYVTGSASNNLNYMISSIGGTGGDAGRKLYVTGNTVTTEADGASVTIEQYHYELALSSGSARVIRLNSPMNFSAWAHRFRFRFRSSATGSDYSPIGWGVQGRVDHEDV